MESIFANKKGPSGTARQSSLFASDVFKKVDKGNSLQNAPEEMKQPEKRVFTGHNTATGGEVNQQADQLMADTQAQHAGMAEGNIMHPSSMLSFEIKTCFQLAYQAESRLGTGCPLLNSFFRGGLLPKRLYEVYGESGTGKSQLAIQLLLNAVLPEAQLGLNGSALFVTAGKMLNDKRFIEMKDNFLAEIAKAHSKPASAGQAIQPVTEATVREQIHLSHCNNLDEYNRLFVNLAARVDEQQIKLVVIDNMHSVCENFIKQDGSVDYIERSQFMVKHSKLLKRLAYDFSLVVVILNNVVADVSHDGANKGFFENRSRGQSIVPSLGLNWSNCINERIALKKKGGSSNVDCKRTIVIEKSSYMRRSEMDFEIVAQGLRGKQ